MYEIAAVRTERSDDQTHEHVALVGYRSPHLETEVIMIPVARVISRLALGDTFGVKAGEALAEVKPAKCPVCGHEPQLAAQGADLLDLPRK